MVHKSWNGCRAVEPLASYLLEEIHVRCNRLVSPKSMVGPPSHSASSIVL